MQRAQPVDLLVVEAARRLVEQQELGLARERAGQLDALLRGEGEVRDRLIGDRAEIERVDETRGPLGDPRLLARDDGQPQRIGEEPAAAAAMAADHDVLARRHGAEEGEILEGAADAERGDGVARHGQQVAPLEQDLAPFSA